MRPYRGMTKEDGKLVKGWYAELEGKSFIISHKAKLTKPRGFIDDFEEVIPKTVGESTGICDIEQKEIYEGDKVEYYVRKKRHEGVVAWGTLGFWIVGQLDRLRWVEHWKIKVIGTIHDKEQP